jgi:hypothetical protein
MCCLLDRAVHNEPVHHAANGGANIHFDKAQSLAQGQEGANLRK